MLADLIQVPVHQHCQTEPVPRCHFAIGAAPG
jgi:hypothetical protein